MEPITAAIVYVDSDTGRSYTVRIVPENKLTDGDGRIMIAPVTWRDGRLPFTFSDVEGDPHEEARHVGNLFNLRKEQFEDATWVMADLDWDTDDLALEAKRLVDEDRITKVSMHALAGQGYVLCQLPESLDRDTVLAAAEKFDPEACPDDNEWVQAWLDIEIGAATLLLLPAFEDAEVISASIEPDLAKPPLEWFTGQLTEPTPLTITEDGQVFGHLALWETCHRGFENQCITPPRSFTEYAQFHENAKLTTAEGDTLGVGCLTFDVSHADLRSSASAAKRHYDHTGTVFAFVRAGEDDFGVWVAGAIRPDLEPSKVETLRRLSLSGDWRPKDGEYHLIAAQAVPVPGFPVKSLVAAGVQVEFNTVGPTNIPPDPLEELSDMALVASVVERLTDEVRGLRQMWEDERNLREYEAAMAELA